MFERFRTLQRFRAQPGPQPAARVRGPRPAARIPRLVASAAKKTIPHNRLILPIPNNCSATSRVLPTSELPVVLQHEVWQFMSVQRHAWTNLRSASMSSRPGGAADEAPSPSHPGSVNRSLR